MRIEVTELRGHSAGKSRVPVRRFLIIFLVVLVLFSVTFIFGLRRLERAIAFHPEPYEASAAWATPSGAEDVWFSTADGIKLHGWFFKPAGSPPQATIIYFHGNGGNVSNIDWVGERFAARGFNVLIFDYRGYGHSGGELADEQGLYADADAAFDFVLKTGMATKAIVLYGQSLGTAAVTDVAARRGCGAVILESGMSSGSDMATAALPWLPRRLHFLARNRFDSAANLSRVHCPVLVSHGDPDDTIPTRQGKALFAAANEPKKLIIVPGVGHNVIGSAGDAYLDTVGGFILDAINGRVEPDK